jgi:hypothetical protein
LQLHGLGAKAVTVAEEKNTLALPNSSLRWLNPLAPSCSRIQTLQKSNRATFNIGAVVAAHNWLDGLGGFISIIEWNSANIMVEDMSFNDTVEELSTNEAKLAIDSGGSTADVVPASGGVVGKRRVRVLEESNSNCITLARYFDNIFVRETLT